MDLIEFLRARLDEDEAAARAVPADSRTWSYHPDEQHPYHSGEIPEIFAVAGTTTTPGYILFEAAPHIARHDPARVLRDVEAKRRIVDEVKGFEGDGDGNPHYWNVLAFLALPCADHEDYDESWRPEGAS